MERLDSKLSELRLKKIEIKENIDSINKVINNGKKNIKRCTSYAL